MVHECTFISSLLVPNIDTMELQVCVLYQFLQSVQKEIKAPVTPYDKEIKMKLWPLVSQKRLGRFSSNLVCGVAAPL